MKARKPKAYLTLFKRLCKKEAKSRLQASRHLLHQYCSENYVMQQLGCEISKTYYFMLAWSALLRRARFISKIARKEKEMLSLRGRIRVCQSLKAQKFQEKEARTYKKSSQHCHAVPRQF